MRGWGAFAPRLRLLHIDVGLMQAPDPNTLACVLQLVRGIDPVA